MSTESNYDHIIASPDPVTRINLARASAEARRREATIGCLRRVALGYYWRHKDTAILDELAEELARVLLHTLEDADMAQDLSLGFLIKGIEQNMTAAPKVGDAQQASKVIELRIGHFKNHNTWSSFENAPGDDLVGIMEFGAAIATHSWRHDPRETGLGSPLMVATIAYLHALEPVQSAPLIQ